MTCGFQTRAASHNRTDELWKKKTKQQKANQPIPTQKVAVVFSGPWLTRVLRWLNSYMHATVDTNVKHDRRLEVSHGGLDSAFPSSAQHLKGPSSSQLPESESNYPPSLSPQTITFHCFHASLRVRAPWLSTRSGTSTLLTFLRWNRERNSDTSAQNAKKQLKWNKNKHVVAFYSNEAEWRLQLQFTGTCCTSRLTTWNWSDSWRDEEAPRRLRGVSVNSCSASSIAR